MVHCCVGLRSSPPAPLRGRLVKPVWPLHLLRKRRLQGCRLFMAQIPRKFLEPKTATTDIFLQIIGLLFATSYACLVLALVAFMSRSLFEAGLSSLAGDSRVTALGGSAVCFQHPKAIPPDRSVPALDFSASFCNLRSKSVVPKLADRNADRK